MKIALMNLYKKEIDEYNKNDGAYHYNERFKFYDRSLKNMLKIVEEIDDTYNILLDCNDEDRDERLLEEIVDLENKFYNRYEELSFMIQDYHKIKWIIDNILVNNESK